MAGRGLIPPLRPDAGVWVARARPEAESTAVRVTAMGFQPLVAPLIATRPLAPPIAGLEGVGALAFTSAAGVRAFAALTAGFREAPVFAVGDATARAARQAGFVQVESADGDVADLARLIAARRPAGRLLHPCAEVVARPLTAPGCEPFPVYATDAARAAPSEVVHALAAGRLAAVLIQSPSAARALAGLAGRTPALRRLIAFALSPACAAPLIGAGWTDVVVAPAPRERDLLARLAQAARLGKSTAAD